ncbi:hypothetical protein [Streptomyces sioyaensis]|uniref:hypothetical protein n=1 Tax=Streptomyces sioyaensis TaxID=67364 RepID=UPI0036E4C6EB
MPLNRANDLMAAEAERLGPSPARAALDAGADPAVVAGWITAAQNEQTAARQQLAAASDAQREILTEEQIHMIKTLGDMAARLQAADPEGEAPLYADFGLELEYHADQRVVTVRPQPADMCVIACPRGDLNPHAR